MNNPKNNASALRVGQFVRVRPSACPKGRRFHRAPARIVGINGDRISIQPFGNHPTVEVVDRSDVNVWKSMSVKHEVL